jgi:aspartate/methionine/tyrosine aminotransferase
MNPLAEDLNQQIQKNCLPVYEMLSSFGKRIFFPKGILSQSAEAKEKAHRFNATIGIALENGEPMHLDSIHDWLDTFNPADLFPYAPGAGKPALREAWAQKQFRENPTMRGKKISHPIVTHALTQGLTLVGDLFVDPGDTILLPDKFWGNYRLIYETRKRARIQTYPFYTDQGGFNLEAFRAELQEQAAGGKKVIVILNFPNNPCGYTVRNREAEKIVEILLDTARQGARLVTVLDEAYFGLFYTEDLFTESLFGHLANQHENLLAVKLDGATKEYYVWGFRVGFLTFGAQSDGDLDAVYQALEKKTMGAIRGSISNATHISQTLILKAMESPEFLPESEQKVALLKKRALKLIDILKNEKYQDAWSVYPFNSGYFMCLLINGVEGEALRLHLLDTYGVGVIATGGNDIRVAFSCIEAEDLEELFDTIYKGVMDLREPA